jgi:hypothetical protein
VVNAGAVGEGLRAVEGGAAGGGAPVRFDGRVPVYARLMLPAFNLGFRLARLTGGCFLFCTREAFDAADRWDETLYASEELTMARALGRRGRFVIVRTPVLTSGRKLRMVSGWALLRLMAGAAASRGRFVHSRDRLGLWYGPGLREKPPGEG